MIKKVRFTEKSEIVSALYGAHVFSLSVLCLCGITSLWCDCSTTMNDMVRMTGCHIKKQVSG